jgi:hypothetical protein
MIEVIEPEEEEIRNKYLYVDTVLNGLLCRKIIYFTSLRSTLTDILCVKIQ